MISMVTFGSSPPRVECALQQALMYIKKRKWKSQFYSHCPCCRSYSRQCKFWKVVWVNSEKSTKSLERQLYDHCIQEIKGRSDLWEIARAAVDGDCNSLNSDLREIARMIAYDCNSHDSHFWDIARAAEGGECNSLHSISHTFISHNFIDSSYKSTLVDSLSLTHTHKYHTDTWVFERYLGLSKIQLNSRCTQ